MCNTPFDWNAVVAISTIVLALITGWYVVIPKRLLKQTTIATEIQARPYFDLSKPISEMVVVIEGQGFARLYLRNHGGMAFNVSCESMRPDIKATVEYPLRSMVLTGENFNVRLTKKSLPPLSSKDLMEEIGISIKFQDAYSNNYVELAKVLGTGFSCEAPVKI